jgi:hypothetical protein
MIYYDVINKQFILRLELGVIEPLILLGFAGVEFICCTSPPKNPEKKF